MTDEIIMEHDLMAEFDLTIEIPHTIDDYNQEKRNRRKLALYAPGYILLSLLAFAGLAACIYAFVVFAMPAGLIAGGVLSGLFSIGLVAGISTALSSENLGAGGALFNGVLGGFTFATTASAFGIIPALMSGGVGLAAVLTGVTGVASMIGGVFCAVRSILTGRALHKSPIANVENAVSALLKHKQSVTVEDIEKLSVEFTSPRQTQALLHFLIKAEKQFSHKKFSSEVKRARLDLIAELQADTDSASEVSDEAISVEVFDLRDESHNKSGIRQRFNTLFHKNSSPNDTSKLIDSMSEQESYSAG